MTSEEGVCACKGKKKSSSRPNVSVSVSKLQPTRKKEEDETTEEGKGTREEYTERIN